MNTLIGLIVPSVILVAWEILSRLGVFPPNWLPAPTAVAAVGMELVRQGELSTHIVATVTRVLAGFAVGAVSATILGAITGYSQTTRRLLDPLLQALRNIPSMAWVPLFLLWLGIQESSKITLIAVGVFFPVYLNLASAIQHVDCKLVEVGRMFRFSSIELIRRVILPAALPSYITGLRSGLGLGWMFVVAAELMGASKGIGYLMNDGQMTGRPGIIIASILLFALCGKATDLCIVLATGRLLKYHHANQV